jgi:hypothetical protein
MKADSLTARLPIWLCCVRVLLLLAGLILTSALPAADLKKVLEEKKSAKPAKGPVPVEVRFTDNSNLKLTVRDETVEMSTRFGKLAIPLAEIRQVEFATRVPEDVTKRIHAAIADLGSPQYRAREAASSDLQTLKEKAYPALLHAAKHSDPEVVRRAEELLARLRETVPDEMLEIRNNDVVHTDDMKITGWIGASSFRVSTAQFGEQQLKLSDVHSMRSLTTGGMEPESGNALPDPGNLTSLHGQIGKTFLFKVTGAMNGSVWGTKTYTSDSPLAVAAVHAGVLRPGQTGVVRVSIVPPPAGFQGSTQNGVTSAGYGAYPGAYRMGR